VNWILDANVRSFFDEIRHDWLLKFVKHRIADRRILRLIGKWLRAGVSEEGKWSKTERGTPQGSVASPMLANIYLHYAFDLWVQHWRQHRATGEVIGVRYAADALVAVLCLFVFARPSVSKVSKTDNYGGNFRRALTKSVHRDPRKEGL
jgi:RNA-directed DNA polymerase